MACPGDGGGQKRRPELGSSGSGALVRARANGAASSLPGDAVSMLVLLRRAGEVGSAGLAGHGGGARELVGQRLEGERDKGRRGKRLQASQRIFWCGRRARGGPVAGESTTAAVRAEDEDGDFAVQCGLLWSHASSWRPSRVWQRDLIHRRSCVVATDATVVRSGGYQWCYKSKVGEV